MKLHVLTGQDAREDSAAGELVLKGRRASRPARRRPFMGRAYRRSVLHRSVATREGQRPVKSGTAVDLSAWHPEDAKNSFAGTIVESIVLEVSHQHPQLKPGARIGVWCATKLATDAGGWRQINRGGHPMMWPIFWPDDVHSTNPANTRHPSQDFDAEGEHIAEHIAAVVAASGTSGDPAGLRPDRGPGVVPRCLALHGRDARDIRLRYPQRPTMADNAPEAMCLSSLARPCPQG